MTDWIVEIECGQLDIQELLKLTPSAYIRVSAQNGKYFIRSDKFDSYTEAKDVLNRGTEIINLLNGIARLEFPNWQPLKLRGVARDEPNGTRSQFVFLEPIVGRIRVSISATVIRADGTIETPNSSHRGFIESSLEIAEKDADVKKALRIYGSREHNWVNLYIIYEVIESGVGGKSMLVGNGWCGKAEIERFKHTANSVGAIGDEARHGKEVTHPPAKPMSQNEAKDLIESLLKQWINSR